MQRQPKTGDPVQVLDFLCEGQTAIQPRIGAILPPVGKEVILDARKYVVTAVQTRVIGNGLCNALAHIQPVEAGRV